MRYDAEVRQSIEVIRGLGYISVNTVRSPSVTEYCVDEMVRHCPDVRYMIRLCHRLNRGCRPYVRSAGPEGALHRAWGSGSVLVLWNPCRRGVVIPARWARSPIAVGQTEIDLTREVLFVSPYLLPRSGERFIGRLFLGATQRLCLHAFAFSRRSIGTTYQGCHGQSRPKHMTNLSSGRVTPSAQLHVACDGRRGADSVVDRPQSDANLHQLRVAKPRCACRKGISTGTAALPERQGRLKEAETSRRVSRSGKGTSGYEAYE